MKKYIRTKDGIYKVLEENNDEYGIWYKVEVPPSKWDYDEDNHCYYEDSKSSGVRIKDVIGQADTAEELCDGFYVDVDNHPFTSTEIYEDVEKAIESARDWQSYSNRKYLQYDIKIYGFVKTSEGLNFVTTVDFGKEELEK